MVYYRVVELRVIHAPDLDTYPVPATARTPVQQQRERAFEKSRSASAYDYITGCLEQGQVRGQLQRYAAYPIQDDSRGEKTGIAKKSISKASKKITKNSSKRSITSLRLC